MFLNYFVYLCYKEAAHVENILKSPPSSAKIRNLSMLSYFKNKGLVQAEEVCISSLLVKGGGI